MGESSTLTSSTSLLDLLSNPVVFDNLIEYFPLQSISRLSRTSRSFHDFIFQTPKVFRYLDASRCRGAYIPPSLTPIDSGGNSWRAERMDENLTEDEFYAGPLRGVLSKLHRRKIIRDVQVLVLDGLASVTNDLIAEIVTSSQYNVRLLSIRKCINLNQSKLQQLLRYICRPGRPENTPRLQGVYIFTEPVIGKSSNEQLVGSGVMLTDGATLGVLPVDKSRCSTLTETPWYTPSGRVIQQGSTSRSSWEETLQACRGIIAFDAVLCTHMHDAMADCLHEGSRDFLASTKPGVPTIATVALGPEGCSGCGCAPDGAPTWGKDNPFEFPLLFPPPYSGRIVDAVRPPPARSSLPGTVPDPQRLIVSCSWCLANRHCDSCHRWWCSDCYNPKKSKKLSDLEALSETGLNNQLPSGEDSILHSARASISVVGDSIKDPYTSPHSTASHVLQPARYQPLPLDKPAVTRECWDCGRVCGPCAAKSSRRCKRCRSEYCVWHNDGCDELTCDWCMFRSGRGSRELY